AIKTIKVPIPEAPFLSLINCAIFILYLPCIFIGYLAVCKNLEMYFYWAITKTNVEYILTSPLRLHL
ncbi:hypothetical protein, partial [Methanothermococcus sp.]|uniref:hypothetical protein n=1 Tax=Methanothermococcus sp. TaxID=2614238 RepID=UPI00258349D3